MAAHRNYDWLAIRRDHARGMSVVAIAKKYGLRRPTVQNRAKRENWPQQNEQMAYRSAEIAIEQNAQKMAEAIAGPLTEALAAQLPLAKEYALWAIEIAKKGRAGLIKPGPTQSEADVFNAATMGAGRTQDFARTAGGIRKDTPSFGDGADQQRVIQFVVAEKPEDQAKLS